MWIDVAVCCWRVWLKLFVRVWSYMWKSLERDFTMIFSVTLMCCDYRDGSLLTIVHPSQRYMASCCSVFTGSNDALCIQPSALDLSVNANMCEPCPSCRMFVQIDISYAMDSNRFSVSFLFHSDGILHCRSKTLSLQPPMSYFQASGHSVTIGLTKTMLLVGTPLVVTRWGNLMHSSISW